MSFVAGIKAKHLWLKLRASYRDARRRQHKWIKSGFTPACIKPWKFQYHMSFLEPFMLAREGYLSDNDAAQPSMDESNDEWEDNSQLEPREKRPRIDEEIIHHEEQHTTNSEENGERCSKRLECEVLENNIPNSIENTTKKKQYNDLHDFLIESLQKRDSRNEKMTVDRRALLENDSIKNDPLFNFFMSMYQITKGMPPMYQHRIRGHLYNAVSQAESEILNTASTSTSASQSPSRNTFVPSQ